MASDALYWLDHAGLQVFLVVGIKPDGLLLRNRVVPFKVVVIFSPKNVIARGEFTAAQAAKKTPQEAAASLQEFTAAQAAKKDDCKACREK